MRKILQNHGKIIMTILGVVLMFVFALPTFRGMSSEDIAKMKVGTLNGRKITNDDVRSAQGELQLLTGLGLLGDLRHGSSGSPEFPLTTTAIALFGGEEQDQPTYWLLLTEDASHYDATAVSQDEVYRAAGVIGRSSTDVNKFLKARGNGMVDIEVSLTHLEMIEQYLRFLEAFPPRPISALELQGDVDLRQVQVKFAGIDAAAGWERATAPTAEQITKQFDLYKHTLATPMPDPDSAAPGPLPPEIAGHHFPFGYKYPDRVTVEYLEFNRAAIKALIKPTHEQDEIPAYQYYHDHPEEFQAPASAPATASAPTTAPRTTTRPWDDVKAELIARQVDHDTDILMSKLVQQAQELAGKPWLANSSLPRDSWVSYPDIAAAIAKSSDSLGYKPEYKTTEQGAAADKRDKGLMSSEQLKNLPGIGKAEYMLPIGTDIEPVPFYLMATHVQELVKSDPKDPLNRLNLQVGTEGPTPLKDKDGNQYLYRVTTVDPSHEPASVDEVKPQVIDDFKKAEAYNQCVSAVKAMIEKNPDVDVVATQYKVPAQTTDSFTRLHPDPKVQAIRDFVTTAFSLKEPPAHPSATAPANAGSATVLPDDSTLHCYPIELDHFSPATGVDFGKDLNLLLQKRDPTVSNFVSSYLSMDALSQRLHYVPVAPPKPSPGK